MDDYGFLRPCQAMYYNISLKQRKKIHKQAKTRLGKNVRRCRHAAGLSQEEVGLRIGLGQGYISHIESGQHNPTLETIAELASALGTSIDNLFCENE